MNNNKQIQSNFNVVIPARYGSSRLPGKPLEKIAGKTMIHRVYENALASGAQKVLVATDDNRIMDEVKNFNGKCVLTSLKHTSGTDRIAEVAKRENWSDDTIVVNLQGDEPAIMPFYLNIVADALFNNPLASLATLATPVKNSSDLFNPNIVKVVTANNGLALYFSRAPIPWVRDLFSFDTNKNIKLPENQIFLRHLGIYAYKVSALIEITKAKIANLEKVESLEQLRAMSIGLAIHVEIVDKAPAHGVDTKEDLIRINDFFNK